MLSFLWRFSRERRILTKASEEKDKLVNSITKKLNQEKSKNKTLRHKLTKLETSLTSTLKEYSEEIRQGKSEKRKLLDDLIDLEILLVENPKKKNFKKKHLCDKFCYSSPSKARRMSKKVSCRVRIYLCKKCSAWHITTK